MQRAAPLGAAAQTVMHWCVMRPGIILHAAGIVLGAAEFGDFMLGAGVG